ncbi:glycerate kinase [Aestuariivivens sediminicola]|uniref:glycerate kinase n=1 Tax=Aestuariivivens sediminicola TaxID=2913560 RepID=UPI001F587AAC|nr:glycerate kinase [Aestuariivivens sediminicola]
MRIVIAPDKFKGSLTAGQFCNAVEEGIRRVKDDITLIKLPLADGGDGTIEVVNYYLNGETIRIQVSNPFFQPVEATYFYSEKTKTAFIEMAEASGLKILKPETFDCKNATTLGTGELIRDAVNRGAKHILLGIGGSATNDCGIGMARALGYRFLDNNDREVKPIGAQLAAISRIEMSQIHPKLNEVEFKIACDVTNPLYGENGAAQVYGRQKGASEDDIKLLDEGLKCFSLVLKRQFGVDVQSVKGAGAAGGMGIASKLFLNGTLQPGIDLVKDLAQFDTGIEDASWIITGEGRLDGQTLSGKTIQGVKVSAEGKGIKIAALCGAVDLDPDQAKTLGIHYTDAVMNYARDIEDAMANSSYYVREMAERFAKNLI